MAGHDTKTLPSRPRPTFVAGVGITPFTLARRRRPDLDYPELGAAACRAALADAGDLPYAAVDAVVAGYCYGEPTCGQRVAYELGLSGAPVFNVNNNCATGSTALFLARTLVESGQAECALAVGFEKMEPSLSQVYTDAGWTSPTEPHFERMYAPPMRPERVGATREHLDRGAAKVSLLLLHVVVLSPSSTYSRLTPYSFPSHLSTSQLAVVASRSTPSPRTSSSSSRTPRASTPQRTAPPIASTRPWRQRTMRTAPPTPTPRCSAARRPPWRRCSPRRR